MTQTRSSQCEPAVLDDLAQDFRKIAGKRPDGMVSKKSMTSAIIRELVAVAKFGDPRIWYVRAIVDRGFDRKTAYKIVREAYRQAETRWKAEMSAGQPYPDPDKANIPKAPAATSGGGETKTAPAQAAKPEKPLNGDARESDGWVWDKDLQDYRDPQTLVSGFYRVRDHHVWDAREGKFVNESTLPDGYKRIEDGWEWNSTMHAYRNPKGGNNPFGLNLIGNGNTK
ncbi:hypothetical protein [Acidithiobacillus sp.]